MKPYLDEETDCRYCGKTIQPFNPDTYEGLSFKGDWYCDRRCMMEEHQ